MTESLNLPLIPFAKALFVLGMLAVAGAILLLRDQDARDASWAHGLGVILVTGALTGALLVSSWNLVIGLGALQRHQHEIAITTPVPR